MSLQTGVEGPQAPASEKMGDRLRFSITRWRDDPNPLWMREMRQSVRLMRTPVIMMVVTILVVLVMSSIGGTMTGTSDGATAGQVLFHTYFTLAYIVVTLVGPALAANSIASEREGKTWEAVMLTGLRPAVVARGKFLSSFTAIGQYIVMLAPVGALPFLFGGVGPLEVVTAFIFLFAVAALSCTFGLAISAKMNSLRTALLVTLLVSVPLSGFGYMIFGPGAATAVHELWSGVPRGAPIWLPIAYSRAPFGLEYVIYLIVIPVATLGLPTWLLYELTRGNLTSVTDDRTYGLKRWYFVTAWVVALLCLVPSLALGNKDSDDAIVAGLVVLTCFVMFCAFLFAGEPIGPSRRVRVMLTKASALRRSLAPGVVPAARLQLLMTLIAFGLVGGVGLIWVLSLMPGLATTSTTGVEAIILTLGYGLGFSLFVIGLAAHLRSRSTNSGGPRILLLVFLVGLFAGPWILAAIGGVLSRMRSSNALAAAALSPVYIFEAIDALDDADGAVRVVAAVGAAFLYGAVGLGLFLAARRRCYKAIEQHEQLLAEADRRLEEEDEQIAKQAAAQAAEAENPRVDEPAAADHDDAAEQAANGTRSMNDDTAAAEPAAQEREAAGAEAEPPADATDEDEPAP